VFETKFANGGICLQKFEHWKSALETFALTFPASSRFIDGRTLRQNDVLFARHHLRTFSAQRTEPADQTLSSGGDQRTGHQIWFNFHFHQTSKRTGRIIRMK
jgi:cytolysin (calcineurin-like family phosphatase)